MGNTENKGKKPSEGQASVKLTKKQKLSAYSESDAKNERLAYNTEALKVVVMNRHKFEDEKQEKRFSGRMSRTFKALEGGTVPHSKLEDCAKLLDEAIEQYKAEGVNDDLIEKIESYADRVKKAKGKEELGFV